MFDTGRVTSDTTAALAETMALSDLADRFRPVVLAGEKTLSVADAFVPILPMGGLVRGGSVAVRGIGATSVSLALLSDASRQGSWISFVGIDSLGWAAVARAGLDLGRTVAIDAPPTARWSTVVAALVDAFDVVVVDPLHQVGATDARRLSARIRERGSVLMCIDASDGRRRFRWPTEPDLAISVAESRWSGLGAGSGHLDGRVVSVSVTGRRAADRRRRTELRLTGTGVEVIETVFDESLAPAEPLEPGDSPTRHLRRVG